MRVPARLFPHTVRGTLPSERTMPDGSAGAGVPFGPWRGYGEGQVRRTRTETGEEIVTSLTVWLDPQHEVPTGSVLEVTIQVRGLPPRTLRGRVEIVLPRVAKGAPSHVEYRCSGG